MTMAETTPVQDQLQEHDAQKHDPQEHDARKHEAQEQEAQKHEAQKHEAQKHEAQDHDAQKHNPKEHDAQKHDPQEQDAQEHEAQKQEDQKQEGGPLDEQMNEESDTDTLESDDEISRFASTVFGILVGNTQPVLFAHASVLSQSPVLARMCEGPFHENSTVQICLPEDDASVFKVVLEYLYTGKIRPPNKKYLRIGADQLANIYLLADKYDLPVLKEKIVRELRWYFSDITSAYMAASRIGPTSELAVQFFVIAQKIYQGTAASQSGQIFHEYFCETAISASVVLQNQGCVVVQAMLTHGGKLAADFFRLQMVDKNNSKVEIRDLEQKHKDALGVIRELRAKLASMERDRLETGSGRREGKRTRVYRGGLMLGTISSSSMAGWQYAFKEPWIVKVRIRRKVNGHTCLTLAPFAGSRWKTGCKLPLFLFTAQQIIMSDIMSKESLPSMGLSRFMSDTFNIIVGDTKPGFIVHASVLIQSPVLLAMCEGQFQEAVTHNIALDDDNPADFSLMLEYLYTGDFPFEGSENLELEHQLADIYILADKYQLPLLKDLVIAKLSSSTSFYVGSKANRTAFFAIAYKIYNGTTDSETNRVFYNFFAKFAVPVLQKLKRDEVQAVQDLLIDGGRFAGDMFAVQMRQMWADEEKMGDLAAMEERIELLEQDLAGVRLQYNGAVSGRSAKSAELEALKTRWHHAKHHHHTAHPDCSKCKHLLIN
ncbi:MAG: hypothetical protein Q9187_005276 [Circinaria calcarea]